MLSGAVSADWAKVYDPCENVNAANKIKKALAPSPRDFAFLSSTSAIFGAQEVRSHLVHREFAQLLLLLVRELNKFADALKLIVATYLVLFVDNFC